MSKIRSGVVIVAVTAAMSAVPGAAWADSVSNVSVAQGNKYRGGDPGRPRGVLPDRRAIDLSDRSGGKRAVPGLGSVWSVLGGWLWQHDSLHRPGGRSPRLGSRHRRVGPRTRVGRLHLLVGSSGLTTRPPRQRQCRQCPSTPRRGVRRLSTAG
jgi:hypothetical protein